MQASIAIHILVILALSAVSRASSNLGLLLVPVVTLLLADLDGRLVAVVDGAAHVLASLVGVLALLDALAVPVEALLLDVLALLLVLGLVKVAAAGAGAGALALVGLLGGLAHLLAVVVVLLLPVLVVVARARRVAGLAVAGEQDLDRALREVELGGRGAIVLGAPGGQELSIQLRSWSS
ncbi:hypothetical protein PG996_006147 [Apiospora saccharicola]|uniref:Uncharacterized protein n=1 Tax=Apiospora saccharicola TaxID=335842 RepID=A0ABR1VSC1_9PEZI